MNLIDFYKDMHAKHGVYGNSAGRFAGDLVYRVLKKRPINTLLDFGCGKGALKKFLRGQMPKIAVTNYDPAIPGIDTFSGTFDCVACIDVLEHVDESELESVIRIIFAASERLVILMPACYEVHERLPDGRSIHCTVKPPAWWREKCKQDGWREIDYKVINRGTSSYGPKDVAWLVYERETQ